jgi:hypothetical protein
MKTPQNSGTNPVLFNTCLSGSFSLGFLEFLPSINAHLQSIGKDRHEPVSLFKQGIIQFSSTQ